MTIAKLTSTAALVGIALSSTSAFAQSVDVTEDVQSSFREQVTACRNLEDADAKKTCFQALREDKPNRVRRMRQHKDFIQDVSEEVRSELSACRDADGDREAKKACVNAVLEANGIETPEHENKSMIQAKLSTEAQAELNACKEQESRQAQISCAKNILNENGIKAPRKVGQRIGARVNAKISAEVKAELQTCRDEEDGEAMKSCMEEVLEAAGIERPVHNKNESNNNFRLNIGNRGQLEKASE